MFVFGDATIAARLYVDEIMTATGPSLPDLHFDEMEEQDLRNAMTWLHCALSKALREGESDELIEILEEWYTDTFQALAGFSEAFREKFFAGLVYPPGGPGARPKYLEIVRDASES